ncbi:amidase [Martiniozyma asiatica (nom. inval.)]|nr:amidase [Martiniozyma asiatica]
MAASMVRVALIQTAPLVGKTLKNTTRWKEITGKLKGVDVDLLVAPELAICGYNFSNEEEIRPFLEEPGKGLSTEIIKDCIGANGVGVIGYPELEKEGNIIYNSAMAIKGGKILHNHRKVHLYETDKTWGAKEGSSWQAFNIPIKNKNLKGMIGICMDLNPWEFKAPFEKYEFANAMVNQNVELGIICTAWMNSSWSDQWSIKEQESWQSIIGESPLDLVINDKKSFDEHEVLGMSSQWPIEEFAKHKHHVDANTLKYWIMRLKPLWERKCTMLICNRAGIETNAMYAGSSMIIRFNGSPVEKHEHGGITIDMTIEGYLPTACEGILVRDIPL